MYLASTRHDPAGTPGRLQSLGRGHSIEQQTDDAIIARGREWHHWLGLGEQTSEPVAEQRVSRSFALNVIRTRCSRAATLLLGLELGDPSQHLAREHSSVEMETCDDGETTHSRITVYRALLSTRYYSVRVQYSSIVAPTRAVWRARGCASRRTSACRTSLERC